MAGVRGLIASRQKETILFRLKNFAIFCGVSDFNLCYTDFRTDGRMLLNSLKFPVSSMHGGIEE